MSPWAGTKRALCSAIIGPVARKLRPDLTRDVTTPASFPFNVWPWQFMPKMIETEAMIHLMVAKKCRFRRK
jgi:hypothetical protein